MRRKERFSTPLDKAICGVVLALRDAGIETFESCQGGPGHAYPEPTVRFYGQRDEGLRAVAVALRLRLPVLDLKRVWRIEDGELVGPWWEMIFAPTMERPIRDPERLGGCSAGRADGLPCLGEGSPARCCSLPCICCCCDRHSRCWV